MDPLTCISLAGTVVQFVDFSCKLISAGGQLYEDSELEEHAHAAAAVKEIQDYAATAARQLHDYKAKLRRGLQPGGNFVDLTEDEAVLESLCRGCNDAAETLIKHLDKLKVPENSKNKGWKSLEQAILSVWTKKEIDRMMGKLKEYRKSVDSRVLLSLGKRVDLIAVQQSRRFETLGRENQTIITALLNIQNTLTGDLQIQITALSQLLNRTEVVVADQEDRTRRMIVDVFQKIMNSEQTSEEIEAIQNIKKNELMIRKDVEQELLQSLRFATITERFEEVAEAHQKTFQWIFQSPEYGVHAGHGKEWSRFPEWLRNGNGLYWINGKAASGKSTLMKYIFTHSETRHHLRQWGAESPLYIAGFFFWISGTKEQKSQTGLLRSLLYDILQQNPRLIPVVLPKQWSSRYSAKLGASVGTSLDRTWQLSTLKFAFKTLTLQDQVPFKLCLFVDGLDEYDGDENEIAKLFGDVSNSPNVKCCVSSRPHLPFQDAFTGQAGLRLEDLTYPDIRHFVLHELENDYRMQQLTMKEPNEAPKLIEEIVSAANGVFLWVKLVVASLLQGLGNHDQISDLQARLRVIPKKLEDLYIHMVLKVDAIYQEEASRLYQLIAAASNTRDDDWRVVTPLTIFTLALAEDRNPDLALTAKVRFMKSSEIYSRCKKMGNRLTSRCGGLIEVQYGNHPRHKISPSMKVSYLHRTVKDCIEKWDTQAVLKERTGGSTANAFNPNLAIMKAYILELKSIESVLPHDNRPWEYVNSAILYARRAEADTSSAQPELVDELFKTITPWMRSNVSTTPIFRAGSSPVKIAIQCGLQHYLRAKMATENVIANKALLDYALIPSFGMEHLVNAEVVSILIEFGAEPRRSWTGALSYIHQEFHQGKAHSSNDRRDHILKQWTGIIKQFVQAGVEINKDSKSMLEEVFSTHPQLWSEIQSSLSQRRKSKFLRVAEKSHCAQQ